MATTTKPLISYYGGKQRIAHQIVPHLQAIPHTVRAIPFAGGLGVFYKWHRPMVSNCHHYREVINDHSELLINLYRVARDSPDEFHQIIRLTPYSQADHRDAIAICKAPVGHSSLKLAWAYYVNIQQSFANSLNAGWRTSVFGRNQAATWANQAARMPEVMKRLADVHIACEDALEFIQRWDSPQTLFYCDPPYPCADQGHYGGYTMEDWGNLCTLLDNIQGSYVVSNYDQPIQPTADYRVEVRASASSSPSGTVGKGRDKSRAATSEELGDRSRVEILWVKNRSASIRNDLAVALAQGNQGTLFD